VQSISSVATADDCRAGQRFRGSVSACSDLVDGLPEEWSFKASTRLRSTSVFVDRDRSLWMGTPNNGVYRVSGGRVDRYSQRTRPLQQRCERLFRGSRRQSLAGDVEGSRLFPRSPVVPFSANEGSPRAVPTRARIWRRDRLGCGSGSLDALRGHDVTSIRFPGRAVALSGRIKWDGSGSAPTRI
jgi:hypothetical protein